MPRRSLKQQRHTLRLHAAFALLILVLAAILLAIEDTTTRRTVAIIALVIDLLATGIVLAVWLNWCDPECQFHSVTPILQILAPAPVCLTAGLPDRERIAALIAIGATCALGFFVALWRVSRFESRHAVELAELYEIEMAERQAKREAEERTNEQRRAEYRAAREAEEQQQAVRQAEERRQAELESETTITNLMRMQYKAAQNTMAESSTGPTAHHVRDHDGNESDYPSLPPAYPRDEEERLLGKQ